MDSRTGRTRGKGKPKMYVRERGNTADAAANVLAEPFDSIKIVTSTKVNSATSSSVTSLDPPLAPHLSPPLTSLPASSPMQCDEGGAQKSHHRSSTGSSLYSISESVWGLLLDEGEDLTASASLLSLKHSRGDSSFLGLDGSEILDDLNQFFSSTTSEAHDCSAKAPSNTLGASQTGSFESPRKKRIVNYNTIQGLVSSSGTSSGASSGASSTMELG
jgi:hypothetical protein